MTMHDEFLKMSIDLACTSVDQGQTPFGSVIVKNKQVIASTHNLVWKTTDPTAHAEVNAIREACKRIGSIDLSGCILYSSCEPCPMCFSAIHWAKLDAVYFSARIKHAQDAGFNELSIPNEEMKKLGGSPLKIIADLLPDLANVPFKKFLESPTHKAY
jgi:guanine deaminase